MVVATATRRRADGGPSARSLLISVLGQWVGPTDTPVWTATLVGALEALGIEARAARQAVNRTAADGWLEGESVGRYTRWRLRLSLNRLHHRPGVEKNRRYLPEQDLVIATRLQRHRTG